MSTQATKKTLTKEELKEAAKTQGKKLGWLISQLFSDDEERQAMLTMTEKMSLEQLDELIATLEQKYAEVQTKPIDEAYKQGIQEIEDDYQNKKEDLTKNTLNKLDDLTQQVNQTSKE